MQRDNLSLLITLALATTFGIVAGAVDVKALLKYVLPLIVSGINAKTNP